MADNGITPPAQRRKMKRPPLPPPKKKTKKKKKDKDKDRDKEEKEKEKEKKKTTKQQPKETKQNSKQVQVTTTQKSDQSESLWAVVDNPLSKVTDNDRVRRLQLLMEKGKTPTTTTTPRVYREPRSHDVEIEVFSISNSSPPTTRLKTTSKNGRVVGVTCCTTSLDLACWSTLLYFLIILGTASGVLVWYAVRVLSVTLPSNNVGLTHLNQERMWMGYFVFLIIIVSLLSILLCFPLRMKARTFSLLLKLGCMLGMLVFLMSLSIGPPPICKDETLEESRLRQGASCFASGRNESVANSSSSSSGGGSSSSSSSSSRNSSISSQAVSCVLKETRTTSEIADEICSELPLTGVCSKLAVERGEETTWMYHNNHTIYGHVRCGVNYPGDLDVVQNFFAILQRQFDKYKSRYPECSKIANPQVHKNCKLSSMQEAIDSKECFSDANMLPNEAADLILETLRTRVCDGFFEFCDPTGTHIVPHCSSRTCDASATMAELYSKCEDGTQGNQGSTDIQSVINNLDLILSQLQGNFSRQVVKQSIFGLGNMLGLEDLRSRTCQGHGITWYAPPGDSCTSKPFDKLVVKIITNHSDVNKTTEAAKPLCREQESWQTSIHANAVVSVSMIFLLLLASAIVASQDAASVRSAATAAVATPATNCKTWFGKDRRRKISLFFVMAICITIVIILVVASEDLLKYSTNELFCLTGDQQLRLYWSHAALTFTACAVGFYGTVGVVSAWLYRKDQRVNDVLVDARTTDDEQNINCCTRCTRCFRCQSFFSIKEAVSFENGHYYLLFMLFLEVVEISNQVIQMFLFGGERDVTWVVGVSMTMLFGGVLLPIPILQEIFGRSISRFPLSKSFAALSDILLDTVYLALALIVHKQSFQLFASDSWLVAVFGFIFPALGAINTLTDIAEQACAPKHSHHQSSTTLVTSESAKKCINTNCAAVALTIAAVIFSIGMSSSFLINASAGYTLCEDKLGADLFHGAFPKVVLLSGLPHCDLGRVVSVQAPWTKSKSASLHQLRSLPSVMSEMYSLEVLNVSGHNISWIPVELLQKKAAIPLKIFMVDGNPIEKFLNLSGSNITEFPEKIVTFFKNTLEELNLSFTELSCYPRDVGQLSKLTLLDLTSTRISYAPPYAVLPSFRGSNYFYSPSNYPNVTVFLNNTLVSKSLDWSYEFHKDMPSTVIEKHLSEIFPLLTDINLAGNDITIANFPPLHLFSKLRMINISHNALREAPWRHIETLAELDALDAEHNQLSDASMTMRLGPNGGGLTCAMLEKLRTMSSFSVAHNFITVAKFQEGDDTDPKRPNEKAYFQQCSQGSHAVMKGAVAAAKFMLPHVLVFEWRLAYCNDTSVDGWTKKDYSCLSAGGSELSVASVLSIAAPEKLGFLLLQYLPIGPFPAAKVTTRFKRLKILTFDVDLSGSSSVSLEGMYAFPSLEKLDVNSYWSNENGRFFCVDRNAICTKTTVDRLPRLSPSIQNLKNLWQIEIGHIQGGNLPIELFKLPNLQYLRLEQMSFAPLLFETFVKFVGESKTLKSLEIWKVRWRSSSNTTCMSSAGGQAIDDTAHHCTADGKSRKKACCSGLKICSELSLDMRAPPKNIDVCRKTCCGELPVRPLPDFGMIWKNTPIQHLLLAWSDLTFQESPVSVAPFLKLPNLSILEVCAAYTSSRYGSPSFALVPFNNSLDRNLTTHIGNCGTGITLWERKKGFLDRGKQGACSWSEQTVCIY